MLFFSFFFILKMRKLLLRKDNTFRRSSKKSTKSKLSSDSKFSALPTLYSALKDVVDGIRGEVRKEGNIFVWVSERRGDPCSGGQSPQNRRQGPGACKPPVGKDILSPCSGLAPPLCPYPLPSGSFGLLLT